MISKRTVFILGAGAHHPYGFPSGKELMGNVVDQLMRGIRDADLSLRTLPQRSGVNINVVQQKNIEKFIESLSQAGQASIDSFINSNQHMTGFDVIGKAGIAQAILNSEAKFLITRESNKDNKHDWFEYLFAKMCDGVSRSSDYFRDNKISFITFNYDRLLEHKFFNALKHSFNPENDQELLDMVRTIPIHHVYGSLGEYDPNSFGQINYWDRAFKSIQTIHEVIEEHSAAIKSAKKELEQAEKICLLGFGYHKENIELLDLSRVIEEVNINVVACRFGITDEEMRRVTLSNRIRERKLEIGKEGEDALNTLRNRQAFDS
ncbi:hypothetical protein [Polynucleobacter sp. JS-Fieb-80-E5]|uniref:hypothetical protein n=1 Tax=Polynucleobacter sp. JS-Fieb-80-E5 TaxID=2081050 RepID=UPI001C0C74EE|nr:hypothetical protein [Polynucleobacter sp. JS-Fieb-80-E5]MBU3619624.1 hypothetical protein [Polynucleobacter sp. JS-Fieb-80-E5]